MRSGSADNGNGKGSLDASGVTGAAQLGRAPVTVTDLLEGVPDGLLVLEPIGEDLIVREVSGAMSQVLGPREPQTRTLETGWPVFAGSELAGRLHELVREGCGGSVEGAFDQYFASLRTWVEARVRWVGPLLHVYLRDVTWQKDSADALQQFATDLLSAQSNLEAQATELKLAHEATESARRQAEELRRQAEQAWRQAEEARLQAELARHQAETAREAAEAASLAKTAFLANMSHEIRTPMTAIVGFADLMLEPGQTGASRVDCLQTIRRNARHLLELINDILDVSKIEAGKMTVERMAVELPKLIAEVVSMMRPRALEKGLDFQLSFDPSAGQWAMTDPLRLKQILVNLVGNAIKFTERGVVQLSVSGGGSGAAKVGAGRRGGGGVAEAVAAGTEPGEDRYRGPEDRRLVFEVTDTGVGISPQAMGRLFDPFTQGDGSTTRKFGGTGLGLTISRRLARMLGGEITVESELGYGSKFRLEIDGGRVEGLELRDALPLPVAEGGTVETLPPCRILLVEDGKDNQKLIKAHLVRAGATVELADNGRIALEKVTAEGDGRTGFDVILMDMQMPELDGYAATSELRRRGVTAPVLALTAHAMSDDRGKCMAAGCTDYLTKPIDRRTMLAAIARHLPEKTGEVEKSPFTNRRGPLPAPIPLSGFERTADPETGLPRIGGDMAMAMPLVSSEFRDDPDFTELLESFVDGLPVTVSQVVALRQAQRWDELARVVHQLKGAGGGFGFPGITTHAGEAEKAVKAHAPDADALLERLVAYCRSVEGYRPALEATGPADVRKSA